MESLSLRGNEGPGEKEDLPPQDLQEGEGTDTREGSPEGKLEKAPSRTKTKGKEGQVWPLAPCLEALFEMALHCLTTGSRQTKVGQKARAQASDRSSSAGPGKHRLIGVWLEEMTH